jgi:pantoate--beta-alanine ligase
MSSRNAYLTPEQRRIAPALAATLGEVARRLAVDGGAVPEALEEGRARLRAAGFAGIDYLEVCDAETLLPLGRVEGPARVLAAVRLGTTRLIDNVPVAGETA